MMMSWENPRISHGDYKKAKLSCSIDHNHSDMASEIFLAVFRACFDVLYDASNESGLRWWINENIRDFIAPTFIRGNPFNVCTVWREGHRPKVLVWIMEEFFHISHDLTDMDHDGCIVFCYELMIEVERRFRIK